MKINLDKNTEYLRQHDLLVKDNTLFLYLVSYALNSKRFFHETQFRYCSFPFWLKGSTLFGVLINVKFYDSLSENGVRELQQAINVG